MAGVSGNTGSAAASVLLEKGQPVRVLVRSEEKGKPWKDRGAEVAVASLEDASGQGLAKGIESGVMRFQDEETRHVRGPTTLENVLARLV